MQNLLESMVDRGVQVVYFNKTSLQVYKEHMSTHSGEIFIVCFPININIGV